MNSDCESDALCGLVPCCEDWHAKVILLSVSVFTISTDTFVCHTHHIYIYNIIYYIRAVGRVPATAAMAAALFGHT